MRPILLKTPARAIGLFMSMYNMVHLCILYLCTTHSINSFSLSYGPSLYRERPVYNFSMHKPLNKQFYQIIWSIYVYLIYVQISL